jgi:hypothetical protein
MPTFLDIRSYLSVKGKIPFHIQDADESGAVRWYGYASTDGSWMIMEQTTASGSHRYISGTSEYATNWTGRAGLSYDYIFNI